MRCNLPSFGSVVDLGAYVYQRIGIAVHGVIGAATLPVATHYGAVVHVQVQRLLLARERCASPTYYVSIPESPAAMAG